jgi:hypothetical protein
MVNKYLKRCLSPEQWLKPVILDTWEAEIKRIKVGGQSGKIVLEIPLQKQPKQNKLEVWLKQLSACFASMKH